MDFNEIFKEEGEEVREEGGAGDREVEGGEKGDRREVWEKKERGVGGGEREDGKKTSHRAAALAPRVHLDGKLTLIISDMLIAHMRGRGEGLKQGCFALWFRDLFRRGMGLDGGGSRKLKGWKCANAKAAAVHNNTICTTRNKIKK